MDTTEYYNNLKESPLFNLSLASKELFHSNFIAWYAENYRKNFIQFINEHIPKQEWDNDWNDNWKVLRESNNYDICIKDGEGDIRLIIENKVKSIPYKEQLDGYKDEIQDSIIRMRLSFTKKPFRGRKDVYYKSLKGQQTMGQEQIEKNVDYDECERKLNNVAYILLSLSTDFPDKEEIQNSGWTIINYGDLAKFLEKKHKYKTDYKNQLVLDYADFVSSLQEIENAWTRELNDLESTKFLLNFKADAVDKVDDPDCSENKDDSVKESNKNDKTTEYDKAKELRIHDLYGKTRAQRICMLLQSRLTDDSKIGKDVIAGKCDQPTAGKFYISWGFTNGTPILEVKMLAEGSTNTPGYDEFFIQIQGDQYRHAVNLVNRNNHSNIFSEQKDNNKVVLTKAGEEYLAQNYCTFYQSIPNEPEIFDNNKGKLYSVSNNEITNYCQYGGHRNGGLSSFVYYYKKISPQATIQDIIDLIVADVQSILDNKLK